MKPSFETRVEVNPGPGNPPCETHEGNAPSLVTISINNQNYRISRGRHAVSELKRIASVPNCDELSEVIHGVPKPLPQEGHTHIEGGERFLSSPGSCSSS